MLKRAVSQIDIKIHQDWTKLIELYNIVYARWQQDDMPDGKWIEEFASTRYDFGSTCSFIPLDSITKDTKISGSLAGKIIDSMLPWTTIFKKDLEHFNISLNFYASIGELKPHVDGYSAEIAKNGHCRMNYILHDCNATSYVDNDGVIESYPSIGGNAYLLDTTKPHWVINNEKRYVFQCVFYHPFDQVADWFDAHPNLVYGG